MRFTLPRSPFALVLLAVAACGGNVVGGAGNGGADDGLTGEAAADAGGEASASCPPPNPGMCAPGIDCTNGVRRTGQAACEGGAWICATVACDATDAGAVDAGCATIEAVRYDQSCAGDTDCTAVYQGSLCGTCFCPNAAISQGALAAYRSDLAAAGPPPNVCDCATIAPPVCNAGVCTMP